jgi:hypothetical protein
VSFWTAVAVAVTFGWLGMVLAISFLEAPLKFRAPGVTVPVGLGIGRLVFRALNSIEVVLATALLIALVVDPSTVAATVLLAAAIVVLAGQLLAVRPRLTRRSAAVLAGRDDVPRSSAHHAYVLLETIKVIALLSGGVLVLSAG